ncbi:MAG: SGNH/GDSL hydrolase family protein [Taibaiella sp.]|nr:SGNH/GDSL hydrolase family protein [Taibaiella sp.]
MYSFLALGDSYTIGEQVPHADNFPNQTVKLLRRQGKEVADPVIIAVTGWTTDELTTAIREQNIKETFSFVTLLIGVNNQYRNRSLHNYKQEFRDLLEQAIVFAGGNSRHVFVLSIPDWGVTPFAAGRDRKKIAHEIDEYNNANRAITEEYKCYYLYITGSTRMAAKDPFLVAGDGLHPSAKEYAVWAEHLAPLIVGELKK